jgi:FKBP-type peptidyl-prolyl cis-trans isomerase FkpA
MSPLRQLLFCLPLLGVPFAAAGCDTSNNPFLNPGPIEAAFTTTDLRVGTGTLASTGRRVRVNYSLWLHTTSTADNKGQFIERGPFEYTLGAGGVITGWEQGIPGMRVGGLRKLVIPPSLAYGSAGSGSVPGNSTLLFEIELLGVE